MATVTSFQFEQYDNGLRRGTIQTKGTPTAAMQLAYYRVKVMMGRERPWQFTEIVIHPMADNGQIMDNGWEITATFQDKPPAPKVILGIKLT